MSRSRKKNPCHSITCGGYNHGEKKDKQIWHRRFRSRNNQICNSLTGDVDFDALDSVEFVHYKEVSDPWGMAKDGMLHYWDLLTSVKYFQDVAYNTGHWHLLDQTFEYRQHYSWWAFRK